MTGALAASLVVATAHAGAPAAVVANGFPGAGSIIANGTVNIIWAGDAVSSPPPAQLGRDRDFMSVVDSEPYSSTYGHVIWTAQVPNWLAAGLPGGLLLQSGSRNDPHHMLSYTSYIDPQTRRKYTFAGGAISKNVFRFDITSVRNIPEAAFSVCGTQPRRGSLTDDFVVLPNGNIMYTYMSNFAYGGASKLLNAGTPLGGGVLTEIYPMRNAESLVGTLPICKPGALGGGSLDRHLTKKDNENVYLGEYQLIPKTGPAAHVSRVAPLNEDTQPDRGLAGEPNKGDFYSSDPKNASLEALPHSLALTYDGKYAVSSDYGVALSLGLAAGNQINFLLHDSAQHTVSTFSDTIRVEKINPTTLDPVPTYGPRDAEGYASPNTITYGPNTPTGNQADEYAFTGTPTDDPAMYIQSISAVPDGPMHEDIAFHEENEGVMPMAAPHQNWHCPHQLGWDPGPDGVFGTADDGTGNSYCPASQRIYHEFALADAMCGGTMFYTANIRLPQSANNGYGPIWHAMYSAGPCTGFADEIIPPDDRFVIQPVQGIETNTAKGLQFAKSSFDRDFPREHSRRVMVLDIRPLVDDGPGITKDCNGDGYLNEADLACGAKFVDPVKCHFEGSAVRHRVDGSVETNGAIGLPINQPGDGGRIIGPLAYAAEAHVPYAAPMNRLVHNNRASDCPRVLGAVGQFETGPVATEVGNSGMAVGLPTTLTGNQNEFPGHPYAQLIGLPGQGDYHTATEVGGAPTFSNLNTAQDMNTRGGPHWPNDDKVGFCLPTGASNGVATCKPGSYYDIVPNEYGTYPQVYPKTGAAIAKCAQGKSAYGAGTSVAQIDPTCVQRVMFFSYFVELNMVPLPGTGSDGDRTVCMMLLNRVTGQARLDPRWVDELTHQPCLDYDSAARDRKTFGLLGKDICPVQGNETPGDYCWPGARGGQGGAKPHVGDFERDGANLFSPGYFPPASLNLDGNT
jgi:hypothetical protein